MASFATAPLLGSGKGEGAIATNMPGGGMTLDSRATGSRVAGFKLPDVEVFGSVHRTTQRMATHATRQVRPRRSLINCEGRSVRRPPLAGPIEIAASMRTSAKPRLANEANPVIRLRDKPEPMQAIQP